VSITFTGTLPGSFTSASSIATNSAIYNAGTASTDQETVSAFWNTTPYAAFVLAGGVSGASQPSFVGPGRYLFFRGNAGLTSYLYVKIWVQNHFGTGLSARIELGCLVAGVQHVLVTDTQTIGGYFTSIVSGIQAWTLEVTGFAILLTGPGGYSLPVIDMTPVSQTGALYRSAGIGSDESGWLANIADWNFYDSGPTAGPATAYVATAENTASTTFADLPTTTDQVTVNVGASGLAQVDIYAAVSNSGTTGTMVGFAISGATTQAASDAYSLRWDASATFVGRPGASFLLTGLAPGATTFKMKYRVAAGTGTYQDRRIAVTPL
jgi:hypothetical protein